MGPYAVAELTVSQPLRVPRIEAPKAELVVDVLCFGSCLPQHRGDEIHRAGGLARPPIQNSPF